MVRWPGRVKGPLQHRLAVQLARCLRHSVWQESNPYSEPIQAGWLCVPQPLANTQKWVVRFN